MQIPPAGVCDILAGRPTPVLLTKPGTGDGATSLLIAIVRQLNAAGRFPVRALVVGTHPPSPLLVEALKEGGQMLWEAAAVDRLSDWLRPYRVTSAGTSRPLLVWDDASLLDLEPYLPDLVACAALIVVHASAAWDTPYAYVVPVSTPRSA